MSDLLYPGTVPDKRSTFCSADNKLRGGQRQSMSWTVLQIAMRSCGQLMLPETLLQVPVPHFTNGVKKSEHLLTDRFPLVVKTAGDSLTLLLPVT